MRAHERAAAAVAAARRPQRERTEESRQQGLRFAARAVLDYCHNDREAATRTARDWSTAPGGDNRWNEVAAILEQGSESE